MEITNFEAILNNVCNDNPHLSNHTTDNTIHKIGEKEGKKIDFHKEEM